MQGKVKSDRNLDELLRVQIKNPQYCALDFCKLRNFSYSKQINHDNLNLALFSYGSMKHLLAISDGTLPPVSQIEFVSRLQHLANVFELTCLSSSLGDYGGESFNIAKEYDSKVLSDLE